MKTLIFALAVLQPILEHARNAKETMPTMDDLCDESLAKPGAVPDKWGIYNQNDIDVSKLKPSIFLVKDRGAYIMSAAAQRQLRNDGSQSSVVAYAAGCDPEKDEDWYDTALDICGGDDFAQRIEVADIDELISRLQRIKGAPPKTFTVDFVGETQMTLSVE